MTAPIVPIRPGIFTSDDPSAAGAALRGSRCTKCSELFFPPRQVCPRCRMPGTLDQVSLGPQGRIVALTHVVRAPSHYRAPYFLAEIDLAENVRIRTQLEAPEDAPPKVGDMVELRPAPLFTMPDGAEVYGYSARRSGAGAS